MIGTWLNIIILSLSIILQSLYYYPKRNDLYATQMFYSALGGKALSAVSLLFKVTNQELTPKIILISTAVSWEADIVQFAIYLNHL